MSLSPEEDGLSELNKRLYSRGGGLPVRRSSLSPTEESTKRDWGIRQSTRMIRPRRPSIWSLTFLWKLFLGAVVFFLLALAGAAFFLFRGANVVSNQNIDIAVTGPITIKSGDLFDLGIAITNKNRSDLETADLIIEYPTGTRDPSDPQKELTRTRESLGKIDSGQTLVHGVRAILFGGEKSKAAIKIRLEYRLGDSNAIFEKEKPFAVEIADSPISLNLELPPDINSGKEIAAKVEVVSNSPTILKDVALLALWPPGFKLIETGVSAETDLGETIWRLGDLAPGSKRTFNIKGTLDGQDEEVKSFRFQVGLVDEKSRNELAAIYTDNFKSVSIRRPFVGLSLGVNSETGSELVSRLGEALRLTVDWGNNLNVDVTEGSLKLSLIGPVDRSSVEAGDGFYRSADNTISWDGVSVPELSLLKPGDHSRVESNLTTIPFNPNAPLKNPTLNLELAFQGRQNESGRSGEKVETKINRTIRLEAAFQGLARALYYEGPFENTGPIPPRVDQETSYTIEWEVAVGANDVKEINFTAVLPPNVEWLGEVSPSTEKISFNEVNRTVTWEAGYLATGSRGEVKTRKIAFKVKAEPSVSQIGKNFPLLESVAVNGIDTFTGTTIRRELGVVTSEFSTDSGFHVNDDKVNP